MASWREITSAKRDLQGSRTDLIVERWIRSRLVSEPVKLQIRTWNIAHGLDVPPMREGYRHLRRKHLGTMAALMIEEGPDIVALQEVPVWAGPLLHQRTGMGVTLAAAYGAHVPFVHVPLPLAVGAAVGRAVPGVVRTQVEGQANAVLFGPDLLLVSARRTQVNDRRRLRGEPRIIQLVRLRHRRAGRELVVGNVHLDSGDNRAQVERAGFLLERFARGAPMILLGDVNATARSAGVRALVARGWIEEVADEGPRIDHIFVRGFEIEQPATPWDPRRREITADGQLPIRLSDHDPVDAVVSC
jgi:endonuclease/exonuclease/phosphatase family metal-dependent hydrolase